MSNEQAFLQSVLADPEDDTPRLVYADWLDDNGRPERAEFIRVQIELARLPEENPRREELEERATVLLRAHEDEWLGEVGRLLSSPEFRRGFVERGQLGARQFLTHAEELFHLAPIRHLKLLRLPQMKQGPKEVAACPHLGNLRSLDLDNSTLGDQKLQQLLTSPHLHGLTALSLRGTQAGTRLLNLLLSGRFRNLRILNLSGNPLGNQLDRLTVGQPPFALEELDLGDCNIDLMNLAELGAWPGLASVERLRLRNNYLRVLSGEYLAESPHLTRLLHLDLCNTGIGVRGTRALADAAGLSGLRHLELSGNGIGVNGLRALLESPYLTNLTVLILGSNHLGDTGMEMLANWPGLARIRTLAVWNNELTDRGIQALAASPYATNLTDLNLTANQIGNAGVQALTACTSLKRLHLSANYQIRDTGVAALLDSPQLTGLREIAIEGVLLHRDTQQALAQRFPSTR